MQKKILELMKHKKIVSYGTILIVAIIICIPLFSKYMNIVGDDGIQHISRLMGTASSIKEGTIFPVIMSEFCNGFGYSWNIFYSPLTAYLPLLFSIITSSIIVCLKLFMFATILFSGIFMFKLVRVLSNSYLAALLAALIYMTAPYHLTDLYHRVAVAELASFVFLPMIFLGIHSIFEKQYKKSYYFALGAVGLILSHNVIAFYTVIIGVIYVAIQYKKLKDKEVLKHLAMNVGIILLCVSFYLLPLLQHYFAATYEVFVQGRMFSTNTLISSKLGILDLFITRPYGMIFHIGLPIILGILLLFIYRKKVHLKHKKTLSIFLVLGLISIFMSTKLFPFEYLPQTFKMLQFQWRMLEFANFFLSIIAGITISMYMHDKKNKKNIILEVALLLYTLILLLSVTTTVMIPAQKEDSLKKSTAITANNTRLHPNCATFEYLPKKAYQNISYLIDRTQDVKIIQGEVTLRNQIKKNSHLTFEIENSQENTKLELPYIYYLGYNVKLIENTGNKLVIPVEESDNGMLSITIPSSEKGMIEVNYTGTNLMKLSYVLTGLGIVFLGIYVYSYKRK